MMALLPPLEKICDAFEITLSQLFSEEDESVALNDSLRKLLKSWSRLSADKQETVLTLIDKM